MNSRRDRPSHGKDRWNPRHSGWDSVTSELTEDDWLSSGSLSNSARSTSVWQVESFSIKSSAALHRNRRRRACHRESNLHWHGNRRPDVNILRVRPESFRLDGQMIRIQRDIRKGEAARAVGGRWCDRSRSPGCEWKPRHPATTAPEGSFATPLIVPELPDCAKRTPACRKTPKLKTKNSRNTKFLCISPPSR